MPDTTNQVQCNGHLCSSKLCAHKEKHDPVLIHAAADCSKLKLSCTFASAPVHCIPVKQPVAV